MTRNIIYSITMTVALIAFAGCEKNVDIDIDEVESMIVMNGLITSDSAVSIYLTRTRHILDNMEIDVMKDATVEITDAGGNSKTLVYKNDKIYTSDQFKVEAGKEYTVTASRTGYTDVEATCTIPEKVLINRLDTASTVDEYGERRIAFKVVFDDPPGEDNYYMISVRSDKVVTYTEYFYYEDTLYVDLEKDTVVIGYTRDSTVYDNNYNDHVWFESADLAIEQWDYHSNRIIFSDKLFDGKTYSINASFYTWFLYDASDSVTLYVSLHSIDQHYFKYIDSREDHYYAKGDPFAVPVVVHSNIENGVGILGGMSVDVDSFKLAPLKYDWQYYPLF